MKATELVRTRIVFDGEAFAEIVLWQLPRALPGSTHYYKYRLAYIVRNQCVVRYDNEATKGDHRHIGTSETNYRFVSPDVLLEDFHRDIESWNRENRDT